MNKFFSTVIALSLGISPLTISLISQPTFAQVDLKTEADKLLEEGFQLFEQQSLEAYQKAIIKWKEALSGYQKLGDKEKQALTYVAIGRVYSDLGEKKQALDYYQQSLPLSRAEGDRRGEATTLNNIGLVYFDFGEKKQALDYYQQALPLWRAIGSRRGEAVTLNNIGGVYSELGEKKQALDYYQQALPLSRTVGNLRGEATTLNNIGKVYLDLGKKKRALDYYQQVLPLSRAVGDRRGEARTLNHIGSVYLDLGEKKRALDYYQQALPLRRVVGDRRGEATTLNNIGVVYSELGEKKQALDYYQQALTLSRAMGDPIGKATTLNNIGGVYSELGEKKRALDYYQQALTLSRAVGDLSGEAITLNDIGVVYSELGEKKQALDHFQQSLPLWRAVGDRSHEATTLSNIGATYRDISRPIEAIAYLEQSTHLDLELRRSVARQHLETYTDLQRGGFIGLVDLLIQENSPQKAFEWGNRITTFRLADYNRLLGVNVSDPQAQKALENWQAQNERLIALEKNLKEDSSERQISQFRDLEAQINQQAENLVNDYPILADLMQTKPADLVELQKALPAKTTLLQPILLTGTTNVSKTIALFTLTRENIKVTQIPVPDDFNELIKQYPTKLDSDLAIGHLSASSQLYETIIRSIENQIPTDHTLAIIATGAFQSIPFETLYDSQTQQYLLQKYPIHYLTRLSKLQPNNNPQPTQPRILAFANPQPTPVELAGTETEVDHLKTVFPDSQVDIYKHQEATLDKFKTLSRRFPILHLGTHGCFRPQGCENLGMQPNTLLFANNQQYPIAEATKLGLKNTQLITLSACETARDVDGVGLAGLAYIWERAGAKTTLASLWNAEDKITAEIMKTFYQNLKQGMTKSAALRDAKLKYIDQHPFFWSPFILIGDDQPL